MKQQAKKQRSCIFRIIKRIFIATLAALLAFLLLIGRAEGHTHAYVLEIVNKPTCTQDGLSRIVCSTCSYVLTTDTIPATGHTYGDYTPPADNDCTKERKEKRVCKTCGHENWRNIAKGEHDFSPRLPKLDPT